MTTDEITGIPTGNRELDLLTKGWQKCNSILMRSESKESIDDFLNNQIQGIAQCASTNIGVICRNRPKFNYDETYSKRQLTIECGGENLQLDVVEQQNCNILILPKQDIFILSLRWLIKNIVKNFGVGIVFIEDISMISYPPEFKFSSLESLTDSRITRAKMMAMENYIPIIACMDNMSETEKRYRDCDIIGVLTSLYDNETDNYTNELKLVHNRWGCVGKVRF